LSTKNGGKLELRLDGSDTASGAVDYVAQLQTPAGTFRTRARVGEGAGPKLVEFGPWSGEGSGEPPEWLVADARAALKAAVRSSQSEGRWPRRITRWRPEPSG
jgi:hypothetical protein